MAKKCFVLILAATIGSIALRLPQLKQRPMHGDEAVHAFKFGELLDEGSYRYDPNEYHGPTLNYLTLIPAWLSSAEKLTEVSEFTLRIVPVFFSVCLVLLLLLMADGLGWTGSVCAAVLTAISPAMVFYSRYYIQEMLLVCFTFGVIVSGYRYTRNKNIWWALLTGIFLALCHATKETCIIAFGSMLLALLLMLLVRGRQKMIKDKGLLISEKAGPNNHLSIINNHCVNTAKAVKPAHLIAGLVAAAVVSALFHSSFLTNPSGILDSFRTYTTYFSRAGQNQLHIHRWYYYLKMLIYSRYGTGPIWSEALIVLLAVVGFIVAMRGKSRQKMIKDKGLLISEKAGPNNHLSIINNHCNFHLLSFIAFYTLVMTAMYSIIPYKTPWCLLGFLHGMILLAGVGAVALIKLTPNILARVLIGILLVAGGAHLAWQAYLGSYKFYADTRNPYVYAHPTTDVFTITERVKELAEVHPDGCEMQIQVICPEGDYWPLPWYFRCFANVWLWSKIDKNVMPAPIIIASASVEPGLPGYFDLPPPGKKNLYIPLFDAYIELRPGIELRGYVTKDLWDSFDEGRGTRDERRATK